MGSNEAGQAGIALLRHLTIDIQKPDAHTEDRKNDTGLYHQAATDRFLHFEIRCEKASSMMSAALHIKAKKKHKVVERTCTLKEDYKYELYKT